MSDGASDAFIPMSEGVKIHYKAVYDNILFFEATAVDYY
jgi:hypothetical protein